MADLITLVLLMWQWMGLFLRKNNLLRCWGWLSVPNWIGALTWSLLLKLPPRKLEIWFVLWGFFLLRLLCISIDLPYGHAWNTVVMSSLVILVATRNCWISYKNGYAGQLVLHFLPLLKPSLIIKMKLAEIFSYRYYFGICLSELAELVPFPYSQGRYTTCYSGRLHDFSVTIPRGHKDVYVNSFFLLTAWLWNSLPIECLTLTYDLNAGFPTGGKNMGGEGGMGGFQGKISCYYR